MASVVRYTEYTNAQAIDPINDLGGSENAKIAVKVITPAIDAGANGNVFVYKGAGRIKAIMSTRLTSDVGANKPDVVGSASSITVAADGKTVNYAIAGGGTPVLNTDILYLTLVVGY